MTRMLSAFPGAIGQASAKKPLDTIFRKLGEEGQKTFHGSGGGSRAREVFSVSFSKKISRQRNLSWGKSVPTLKPLLGTGSMLGNWKEGAHREGRLNTTPRESEKKDKLKENMRLDRDCHWQPGVKEGFMEDVGPEQGLGGRERFWKAFSVQECIMCWKMSGDLRGQLLAS